MSAAHTWDRSAGRSGRSGNRPLRLDALEPRVLLSAAPGLETLVGSPVWESGVAAESPGPPLATTASLGTAFPTIYDQLIVELINRARADPDAEAARLGIDLNEGLSPGTISSDPKQPLAFNLHIIDAAQGHSQWMLDVDKFQHLGPEGLEDPGDRMVAAGYAPADTFGWGENIAMTYGGPPHDLATDAPYLHEILFVDDDYAGRGHRIILLNADYKEAGIGCMLGEFTIGTTEYDAALVTEDFAYRLDDPFLTGVAYDDAVVDDDFYSLGEALGGVTIVATRQGTGTQYSTTAWDAGGYSLQVPAGTYDIEASGGGLGGTVVVTDVVVSSQNVKLDVTPEMIADTVAPRVADVSVPVAASAFVQVDGTGFTVDGGPFYAPGTNTYYLMAFAASPATRGYVDEVFADAAAMGLTTIRTWGFWEPDPDMPGGALQTAPGVYDADTFKGLDYVVDRAADYGIRLIIPFVNYWPDYGGMDAYVEWDATYGTGPATAADTLDFYTDSDTRQWYQDHVAAVLNRVNSFNGVAYKDDPTIMAWELANEPRGTEGWPPAMEPLQSWIEDMAAYVKTLDTNHLLSTGVEGFYSGRPGGWLYNGWMGADFVANHDVPEIDFATVHVWPQNWGITNAQALTWVDAHITDAHTTLGKPLLIEEFGQFRDAGAGDSGPSPLRNELYEGIFDLAEANDVAGWNFWILYDDAYPDYDSYGVYSPADADTVGLIVRSADALNQKTLPAAAQSPVTTLAASFDEALDAATVSAANIHLLRSGGDRRFGDAADVAVVPDTIALSPDGLTATLTFAETLPDDLYRLTLDGAASLADAAGNRLDGEFDGTLPSGDGVAGGDFVAFFTVETLAEPGQLGVETDPYVGGTPNPDAPAPHSLGFLGLDPNGNPFHRVFAIRVDNDGSAQWLALDGDVVKATSAAPEWHTAAFWGNTRLRGLEDGASHVFYAKAKDGLGAETALVPVGTYATNLEGDVNGSGVATALDYAYVRAALLRGDVFGGTWLWSVDADGSGVLDTDDLSTVRDAVLNPPEPPAPVAAAAAPSQDALAAAVQSVAEPSALLASTEWQSLVLQRARPGAAARLYAPWVPPRLDDQDADD